MGLLALGTPLSWGETQKYCEHVRDHGITQFLNIWKNAVNKQSDVLLWGDEVEYIVVSFNDDEKRARLSLRQVEILSALANDQNLIEAGGCVTQLQDTDRYDNYFSGSRSISSTKKKVDLPAFHPEYGRYMLESTPGAPYGGSLESLLDVESDMRLRRQMAKQHMRPCEYPLTVTSYPRLGTKDFTDPHYEANGPASRSFFLPDEIINPHVRFPTLTSNIRERRGAKVAINVPIYFDTNTPRPFIDPTIPYDRDLFPEDRNARDGAALQDHIYMDSMGFGMGCCCLQITFQAKNVNEGRVLYDQLAPVSPIMMAISAASPIFRGYVADQDCRWNVVSGAVDDRPEAERKVIKKSRYDSISTYIAQDPRFYTEYNDIPLMKNEKVHKTLLENGIDSMMADHIAHLFIRDPLVIFADTIDQDDEREADHFESINTSNWQSIRFKPPPPGSSIGWRVEFRTMEVQVTDFENAAFSVFVVLLTRAVLSFSLNFYMPISLVDENMKRAHSRDACRSTKFWFRRNIFSNQKQSNPTEHPGIRVNGYEGSGHILVGDGEFIEMTCGEIINGKTDGLDFPGLAKLVISYLNSVGPQIETRCELLRYIQLVTDRASGRIPTMATWIRDYVRKHPDYKQDSVVSDRINYDLMKIIEKLTSQEDPALLESLNGKR